MQDRYKFRGYNKNLKKWFYGGYITQAEYTDSPFERPGTKPAPVNHFIIFEETGDWGLPTKLKLALVDKESVGQCTGLKDQNGKLIYEGDILFWDDENDRGYVQWQDEDADYLIIFSNYSAVSFNLEVEPSQLEIIGNIYENKELLK